METIGIALSESRERIDALLLEGLESGGPVAVFKEYWDEKKQKLAVRLGKSSERVAITPCIRILLDPPNAPQG